MKKSLITRQYTFPGHLTLVIWPFILIGILFLFIPSRFSYQASVFNYTGWALVVIWFMYLLEKRFSQAKKLEQRPEQLLQVAKSLNAKFELDKSAKVSQFGQMSLYDLGAQKDRDFKNFVLSDKWSYCDYDYAIYRSSKYGDYKAFTEHYGVMSARLPRELPNVFFDSLTARKRQFRFHFTRRQRHSLEGDFDKYFATYFPKGYTIDSMSFISPDVMWAMREAADYDIEIVGDKLYLYSALYDPKIQLADMAVKIEKIKKELVDNVLTYRDERLPYKEGRQRVTVGAASLERSKLLKRLAIAFAILWIIFEFAIRIMDN